MNILLNKKNEEDLLKYYISQSNKNREYHSSIPIHGVEKIEKKYPSGVTNCADFFVKNERIGRRVFFENGNLEWEFGTQNGKYHGNYYYFHENGEIYYYVNYKNGKQQSSATQWSTNGDLIGISVYDDGTGLELWVNELIEVNEDRQVHLAEERNFLAGERHGFERWWNGDDLGINKEGHFKKGKKHGIFREWNNELLSFEFPKFFVEDIQVKHEKYVQCAQADIFLPTFKNRDNKPKRSLPESYILLQQLKEDQKETL